MNWLHPDRYEPYHWWTCGRKVDYVNTQHEQTTLKIGPLTIWREFGDYAVSMGHTSLVSRYHPYPRVFWWTKT